MGAAQSDAGVRQGSLALVAGSEALAAADGVGAQLETCEIAASRKGTKDALDKAAGLWAASLFQNQASGSGFTATVLVHGPLAHILVFL